MSQTLTLTDAAREACYAEGIEYKDVPTDGRWHEADLTDDPRGRGDGRIKLFPDGQGGLVHNWKASDKPRPFFVNDGRTLSDAERKRQDQERRQAIKEAEQEAKREREQTAKKAATLWNAATALRPDHPYHARKLPGTIPPDTLREIPAEKAAAILGYQPKSNKSGREALIGRLALAPVKAGGKLSTLELIDEAGRKAALYGPGTKPGGCYWAAQPLPEGDGASSTFVIGEGVATVLSVRHATGHHAIAALSAGNIAKVAQAMRDRYPAARLLILADTGNGQDKAELAARETVAALAVPKFTPDQIQAFQTKHSKAPTDFNDLHTLAGLDAVRQQVEAAYAPPSKDSLEKTYTFLSAHDLAALPPMRWRIKGVLPDQGVAAIYGLSGSGKSFIALDITGAVNTGRDWFGHRVNPAPVVYLCLEGQAGLRNRVAAYRTAHGGDALDGVRFIVESFNILTGDPAALIRAIKADGLEKPVVIIDTLNRAAPGADENSGVDMGRIIEAAHVIQQATGGLTALVHHCGKDTARGMRGHSSLHAALDAVIEVKRDGENRKWSLAKAKDGADGIEYGFTLQVHQLGEDEDGDPVTSCSVVTNGNGVTENVTGGSVTKPRETLGRNGLKALEILQDLYDQYTANLIESGKPPDSAKVSLADWCDALIETGKLSKQRAYDGRNDAKRKGYVRISEGYAYLVTPVTNGNETLPNVTGAWGGGLVTSGNAPPIGGVTVTVTEPATGGEGFGNGGNGVTDDAADWEVL